MNSWSVVTRPGWNLCRLSGSAFGLDHECPVTTRPWSTHLTSHQGKVRLPLWQVLNIIWRRIRAAAPTAEDKLPKPSRQYPQAHIKNVLEVTVERDWPDQNNLTAGFLFVFAGLCNPSCYLIPINQQLYSQLCDQHKCLQQVPSAKSQLLWSLSKTSKYVSILFWIEDCVSVLLLKFTLTLKNREANPWNWIKWPNAMLEKVTRNDETENYQLRSSL